MTIQKILISGASIAGPALARWLGRNGFDVTVVEKSPVIRPGGQAVDFKGRTHMTLLERMGILDDVRARRTSRTDLRIVDAQDHVHAVIPGEFIGGDLEIARGDLARILVEHSRDDAEYVLDDEITSLHEDAAGIDVTFNRRAPERFDLMLGADGIHSAVRRLAIGPERLCVEPLGYCYAVAAGDVPLGDLETSLPGGRAVSYGYSTPGRLLILGGPKAPVMFVFRVDGSLDDLRDVRAHRALLEEAFADGGWRVPAALEAARSDPDFYLSPLGRTRMPAYTKGRVALVGDAGYANTLGGFGTGLALLGAYTLAGELIGHRGDHVTALAAYDQRMRRPTRIAHRGNAGVFLAPSTAGRIRRRNRTFTNPLMRRSMLWLTEVFATDGSIPDYRMI